MPPRPLVALGTAFRPRVLESLTERYEIVPTERPLTSTDLPAPARGARALVTLGALRTDAALMDALPDLGLIACYGTGYDGVDLQAAAARDILVSHSPGGNAASVADLAVGLVLAITRRIVASDAYVRSGAWRAHPSTDVRVVPGLTGSKVGIWGLGAVGTSVAERIAAFETEIGYHGRAPRPDVPYRYFAALRELAAWSDILVVTARATAGNRGAVDRDVLQALGPDGHLVNVARGSLVDEPALVQALNAGTIAGAALDVYASEPMSAGPLLDAPNVVLSPHVGGATRAAESAAIRMVLANLDAFFAGAPIPNRVPSAASAP